jgi:hypothetical protein
LDGDIAKKRLISVGGRSDNKLMIENGLLPGDKLITVGFQTLSDGDKVQVVKD